MKSGLGRAAILALLLLGGCSAPSSATEGSSEQDFNRLAAEFRKGHEQRNVPALRRLVHAPEIAFGPPDTFTGSVTHDFAYRIERISFSPLRGDETLSYNLGGIRFEPTMKPAARMVIHFAAPSPPSADGFRLTETSYLVGSTPAGVRIVLAGPVRR